MWIESIIAIGFSDPFFPAMGSWLGTALVAAGLAAIPIILHLLNKRRFRKREWAAIQFVLAAIKKNARRIRLEQLLLLAVRLLLLVLLVMAIAQPYLERPGLSFRTGVRYHKVIVLDGSYSMAYEPTQRSRFERAKEVARQILEESNKGDAVSVVQMASPPRVVVGRPSYDRAEVGREIDALELIHAGADVPATIARVEEVLKGAPPVLTNKEVYFLTDLQRHSWYPPETSGPDREQFRDVVGRLDEQATLVVIDLGQDDSQNLALVDVSLPQPFVTVGTPAVVTGVLHNFGRQPEEGVDVELWIDGQLEARQQTDIDPGSDATVTFSPTFRGAGDHAVELRLSRDALRLDNSRWLALPVQAYVDVLCVNGKLAGEFFDEATAFLQTALAPSSSREAALTAVRPEVVPVSQWADVLLDRYACIFLCNVGQFTEKEYQILERYLTTGGAAVWFLGDQVQAENYNRVLFRDGHGIFPLRLTSRVGNARSPQLEGFVFDPLDYAHPLLAEFRDHPEAGLLSTHVYEYFRGELAPESTARVALAYEGGDPAIVEQSVGRGRVVVVTTSADQSWTMWPASASYVPVVHQVLQFAVSGHITERNTLVGQAIQFRVPHPASTLTVHAPDGQSESLRLTDSGWFSYPPPDENASPTHADWSGIYRVEWAGGERFQRESSQPDAGVTARNERPSDAAVLDSSAWLFAVNLDTQESDLSKLHVEELRRDVWPDVEFAYLTSWQNLDVDLQTPVRHRGDLHRPLLYAVLALLFLELFLAWKFGHYSR